MTWKRKYYRKYKKGWKENEEKKKIEMRNQDKGKSSKNPWDQEKKKVKKNVKWIKNEKMKENNVKIWK